MVDSPDEEEWLVEGDLHMPGVMLPDCLIAMLPSCIQKIIKDITSNIYLIISNHWLYFRS